MSDRQAARDRKAFWKAKEAEAERLAETLARWEGLPDRVPLVPYIRAKNGGIWL